MKRILSHNRVMMLVLSCLFTASIYGQQPTVSSFSPTSGCENSAVSVIITGTNFNGATTVKFGVSTAVSYVVNSSTQITAVLGAGSTGTVSVTTPSGFGASAGTFTVSTVPTIVPVISPSGSTTACTSQLYTADTATVIDISNTGSTTGTYGVDQWQSFIPTIAGQTTAISVLSNGCPTSTAILTIYSGIGVGGAVISTQTVALSGCNTDLIFSVPNLNLTVGSSYTFRLQSVYDLGLNANNSATGLYYSNVYGANSGYRLLFKTYVKPAISTVQWFNNGVAIPGATSTTYTATSTGNYTCKNVNGSCYSSASNSAALTINTFSAGLCPVISSFSPSSICASNSASVVITGAGFTTATAVTIGGTNALSFVIDSSTQITATVGTGTTGTIRVTTPTGYSLSAGTLTINPASTVLSTITPSGSTTTCTGSVLLSSNTPTIIDNSYTALSTATSGSDQWQTFVPSFAGQSMSLSVYTNGCQNVDATLTIYTGTGTAGTVVHSQVGAVNACGWSTFTLPGLNLTAGATYTFRLQGAATIKLIANYTQVGSYYSNSYGLNPGWKLDFQTTIKPAVAGYQWYNAGAPVSGATASTYAAPVSGTYTLKTSNGTCYSAASNTATLTINSAPTITCPANQSVNTAAGTCSAAVTYAATITGIPAATQTYAFTGATTGSGSGNGSGLTFNKGVTTVTITVTNSCGNTNCSFTVTVSDTVNPTITAPANIAGCSATVTLGAPISADNCAVASVTNNAPGSFPMGMTTVTWTVTDTSGNTATAIQIVTISASPTVTTAVATPSAVCAGSPVVLTATPTSGIGSMLSFSTNNVSIGNLNISPANIPALTVSTWVRKTAAPGSWGAIVSNDDGVGYDRAIMVNADGNYHIFAGRDINTGIASVLNQWDFISVYWSSTAVTMWKNGVQVYTTGGESASNSSVGTKIGQANGWQFTGSIDQVSIWDTARTTGQLYTEMGTNLIGNEAGLVAYYKLDEGSGTTTADATANARTATLNGSPAWGAAIEPAVTYLWSPGASTLVSPTVNPTTNTTYSVTITNAAGCSATSAGAAVTVTPLPTITCIANQAANTAAGTCTAVVTYALPTTTGTPTPTLTYAFTGATTASGNGNGSDSTFNNGITTVTLTATNSCGSANCNFTVTVTDNINPTITAPSNIVACQGTSIVLGSPVAFDNCGVATVTNNAPGSYPTGVTTVTWTVTDTSGRTATADQTVTIDMPQNFLATATPPSICLGQSSNLKAANTTLGFSGLYAPSNWTTISGYGGSIDTSGAPEVVKMYSPNPGWTGWIDYSRGVLSATADTTVTFDWFFSSPEDDTEDYPQYILNGVVHMMPGWNFLYWQDHGASESILVPAGQTFAFRAHSIDGSGGACEIVYTNFTATTVSPNTINWYTVPTGGTAIGTSSAGSNFPVSPPAGITSYYAETVNTSGCSNPTRSLVTVNVNTPPTISCIANQTATTADCNALVSYDAPTTGGTPSPTISYVFTGATSGSGTGTGSGSTFNTGVTTVTLTATNSCPSAACSFTVTVTENTPPVITCPATANIFTTPLAPASMTLTFPEGIANYNGPYVMNFTDPLPANATITSIDISFSAQDQGYLDLDWFNLTLADTQLAMARLSHSPQGYYFHYDGPIPGYLYGGTNALNFYSVGYSYMQAHWLGGSMDIHYTTGIGTPTATDNCAVATITNNHPEPFPCGDTTMIWTATDASGNASSCSQLVHVIDNTPPTILTEAMSLTADAACSATGVVLTPPVVADNCSIASLTNDHPSTTFPTGITTVVWTVTDGSGNSVTTNQLVTVTDTTNPIITAPANISACDMTGIELGTATASDNCGIASITNNAPSTFPAGITTVTWTATDVNGLVATAIQTVQIGADLTAALGSNSPVCAGSPLGLTSNGLLMAGYTMNANSGVSFIDISSSGTMVPYAGSAGTNIDIPAFNYNNQVFTNGRINANGTLVLGAEYGAILNNNLSLPQPPGGIMNTYDTAAICAYWDALVVPSNNYMRTQTVGNLFIIQWTAYIRFSEDDTITFQIQLNLSTSEINLVYSDVLNNDPEVEAGAAATIGLNFSDTSALQYSYNSPSLVNGQSITFSPILPTYSWSGPNSFSSNLQNPTIANATAAATGNYTLVITNPITGCSSTQSIPVTVNASATYYADLDNDGYGNLASPIISCSGQPANTVTSGTDCDDTRADINPGHAEVGYDLVDNDCDGLIDEGFTPKVTMVQSAQCNSVLSGIDSYVYANIVAGAQGYSWRVTTMSGPSAGQIQFANTYLRNLRITSLSNYDFSTSYRIEVAVLYNGFLQPYTASTCIVTTPEATTQLSNCGGTITAMSDVIYANIVPFATGYRFRVTNILNPAETQIIDRQLREFRMNLLSNIQYNSTYSVEVAIRNTSGSYLNYGPLCTVGTPSFPTTQIMDSQCELAVIPAMTTIIYADAFTGAQGYRFLLVNSALGYSQSVDRVLRTVTLSNFNGLIAGQTYTIKVSLKVNGIYGPYGKACTVTVPGAARLSQTAAVSTFVSFKAIAYPNPFAASFKLEVSTLMEERVMVRVYDVIGRLIEELRIDVSDLNALEIGAQYPSGVYNIVVSQAENVKILRIIKR